MNLLKLEMMDATERLAVALKARGIFCSLENDLIAMGVENTANDIFKVKALLNELSLPIFWLDEKRFQVLLNKLPISVMKKIMNHKGKSFPIHMEGYNFYWRAFAQRWFGIKVNALDLHANIAMFVKSLNLSGITSLAGCNGHHRYSPNVQLSGPYQGAWYEIVQEKFLSALELNSEWKVEYGNRSGAAIIARKTDEEKWDMNKIYQDTVLMAEELQRYSKAIRILKKNSFYRSKKMAGHAKLLEAKKDYRALKEWMLSCLNDNSKQMKIGANKGF
ncbi:hypothetical protein [Planococcus sp. YIM B11945]|uniref:hypothetical protein n=1 Tax=Planococcus sp. YIM B11945 TaxID=3435410 RepID=UPI003D7D0B1F